ncbi:MAG TPA: hypothetical protein DDW52_25145 [Planctomycetaceae bacterium]|nr:hypothetical protein [Planctomycetaceae bacterium]
MSFTAGLPKRILISTGFLCLVAVASNLPLSYSNALEGLQPHEVFYEELAEACEEPNYAFAGFPRTYYASSDVPGTPVVRQFSISALAINVATWATLIALFFVFESRSARAAMQAAASASIFTDPDKAVGPETEVAEATAGQTAAEPLVELSGDTAVSGETALPGEAKTTKPELRSPEGATGSPASRRLGLIDLLALVSLAAVAMVYYRGLEARYQATQDTLRVASVGGECHVSAMLPDIFQPVLPAVVKQRFAQISAVRLDNPKSDVLSKILASNLLQRLRIGGDIDDVAMQRIGQLPLLRDLRISGTKLSDADVLALTSVAPQLQSISFIKTNVTWGAFDAMGPMPRLKHVSLVGTNCDYTSLQGQPWLDQIQTLALPHPGPGGEESLVLTQLPELLWLSIFEVDETMNRSVVKVDVSDCPRLRRISLDPLQVYDVRLRNLPNCNQLEYMDAQLDERTSKNLPGPGCLPIRNLEVDSVPLLTSLNVDGNFLESYQLSGSQNLTFGIGIYKRGEGTPSEATWNSIPLKIRQAWIDDLSNCEGPAVADFSYLPLEGVDFSSLARNTQLSTLDLSASKADRLDTLPAMPLSRLGLQEMDVAPGAMQQVVQRLSRRASIDVTAQALTHFQLEDAPHLRSLFPNDNKTFLTSCEYVSLKNLGLTGAIILPRPVKSLHVEQMNSLEGLHLFFPLPPDTHISGIDRIKYLSLGGRRVTDDMFDVICNSREVQVLNLAHTSISRESLLRIGQFKQLTRLMLVGCEVDDDVMEEIAQLPNLEKLFVGQTEITHSSLALLSQLPSLKILSVSDTPLAKSDLSELANMPQLESLAIGGATLDESLASTILTLGNLQSLDLSGSELTSEGLKLLASRPPPKLRRWIFRDLDQPKLDAGLLQQLPGMVDVTNSVIRNQVFVSGNAFDSRAFPTDMLPREQADYFREYRMQVALNFLPEVFEPGFQVPEYQIHDNGYSQTFTYGSSSYGISGNTVFQNSVTPNIATEPEPWAWSVIYYLSDIAYYYGFSAGYQVEPSTQEIPNELF